MFDVLLITGGAGSGKTTTAEAWASSRQGLAAHLSHDAILNYVKSGVVSPAASTSAEAERQWRLGIEVCIATSHIYVAAGIRCAIDTFLLPGYRDFWQALAPVHVGIVVLHPAVEVAVTRNAARLEAIDWGVPEWQVRANHDAMDAWYSYPEVLMIDNSTLECSQVLAAVDEWEAQET